ncbi:tetratricopeptide repeat protein [Loktanella sp. SALINAS62]|uniref:tetratricopeptide repeat protein n=1 Tax=Loktanella sp. SALINAS62 TaxID=2706124 RepID=UPI001B8C36DA|nr:tetratricopeptide repeat protein [Loktanella sp. SALINAS62]MBS1303990.1 tetratricopeptide repeat protein [Loktanella sp. SALINAS62]
MRIALIVGAAMMPVSVFAAGPAPTPPKPTQTTEDCPQGQIFDLATQTCMAPEDSTNDDSAMMDAVRELAYFGRYTDAAAILRMMPDQQDDLVLTYKGFVTRKMGDMDAGMAFYADALAINPANLLARSYMGQAHVELGEIELASVQLSEIQQRGGSGTWAESSLRQAINSGRSYNY